MTTTTTETLQEKISRREDILDAARDLFDLAGKLEQEILEEMAATGATAVLHDEYEVTTPVKREYDAMKVAQLGEVIPADYFRALYIPEREETVVRPPKVDGRVAQKLLKTEYAAEIEKCLLPSARRLKVTPKGEKS